jgi:mannose-1-phosphate guanylyltransferase
MERLAHDPDRIDELWSLFDATSIDYGVMERSRCVLITPATFDWSDVGAWTALPDVLPAGEGGWCVADQVVAGSSEENIVHAPGKLVALLGIHGLVVVDTSDVLLVADSARAQEIGRFLGELERRGLSRFL